MRKITFQLPTDTVEIVFFEIAVSTEMVAYKYCHYLAFRTCVPYGFCALHRHYWMKANAYFLKVRHSNSFKFINNTENFSNFVLGNHRLCYL